MGGDGEDEWDLLGTKELLEASRGLAEKMREGTATRDDKETLREMTATAERRNAEKDELGLLDTATLLSRSEAVAEKMKEGTATRADKEMLVAMNVTAEKRKSEKDELGALDTATLLSRSAAVAEKMREGTATRADKEMLHAMTATAEKQKDEMDGLRTAGSKHVLDRAAKIVAAMKEGTATKADIEVLKAATHTLEDRKKTADRIMTATSDALLARHAALVKTLKTGTATRADKEELAAILKREEELKKRAKELEGEETRRKLETARRGLMLTERRTEIREVLHMVKQSEKTDLVFMVDATGSMARQIANVKEQIVKITKKVKATNQSLKLRVAAVFYRDALDGDGGNTTIVFDTDVESFSRSVGGVSAHGGGDGAEDVASGLRDVMKLDWASPTRLLIHIADAPSHGARYHNGCDDHHVEGDHGIPKLLLSIKQMNVEYVFGRMNAGTDKMIDVFNGDVGEKWIKSVPITSADEMTKAATTCMRTTMHATFSRLTSKKEGASKAAERVEKLTSTMPDWDALPELRAEVYSSKPLTDISSLGRSKDPLGWFKDKASALLSLLPGHGDTKVTVDHALVKVGEQPFAQGNLRFARHGMVKFVGASGEDGKWRGLVLKDFKMVKDDASKDAYLKEMEASTVANALAKAFVADQSPPIKIRYAESPVISVQREGKPERYFFVEEKLEGEFTKFSNNTGYFNPYTLNEWLLRFSLWTYEKTDGYLMVSDLQGVLTEKGYVLTDPVILCKDELRFGTTNMGPEAMERVRVSAKAHLDEMRATV